jgi:hypothetical protein
LNSFRAPKRGLKNCCAECFILALSKEAFAECFFWHSANKLLCQVIFIRHSAKALLSVFYLALGKAFFVERPKKKRSAKPPALGKKVDSGSVCLGRRQGFSFPWAQLVVG